MTESSLFGVTVSCHPELVSGSGFDLIQGRVLALGRTKVGLPEDDGM